MSLLSVRHQVSLFSCCLPETPSVRRPCRCSREGLTLLGVSDAKLTERDTPHFICHSQIALFGHGFCASRAEETIRSLRGAKYFFACVSPSLSDTVLSLIGLLPSTHSLTHRHSINRTSFFFFFERERPNVHTHSKHTQIKHTQTQSTHDVRDESDGTFCRVFCHKQVDDD